MFSHLIKTKALLASVLIAAVITNSSCGFFGESQKKDNRAEVWGISQEELDLYQPFLDHMEKLPKDQQDRQMKAFRALSDAQKKEIREFFQYYATLTPEQKNRIKLGEVDLEDTKKLDEYLAQYKALKNAAFLTPKERKEIFKEALGCMRSNKSMNIAPGSNVGTGAIELVPHDFHFPQNPDNAAKRQIVVDLRDYLEREKHMWARSGDTWGLKDVWTDWFINWGYAATKEMVVLMMFRSTVLKSIPLIDELMFRIFQTGRQGFMGPEFQPGMVEFQMIAVDPTADCAEIGRSEVHQTGTHKGYPWIFTWAMLPSVESLKRIEDATKTPQKQFPATPIDYQVAIIMDGGIENTKGEVEIHDAVRGYLKNHHNEIVETKTFKNFDLLKIYGNYINEKHRYGMKEIK